ncbi:MAG: hypothetical protein KDD04_05190, partial [Sinomicrobium sp.]|nr:hypothetical protein [Sinomicrobium sp.]
MKKLLLRLLVVIIGALPIGGRFLLKQMPRLANKGVSKVWKLPPVKRGTEIEIIRAGPDRLPGNFPVVDIYRNGTAISVKSIDLAQKTYRGKKLLSKVKQYINKLIEKKKKNRGLRRVPGTAKKDFEIVIPKGRAKKKKKKL